MKNKLSYIFSMLVALFALASCNSDNKSDLRLEGDTFINGIVMDGFDAVIDNQKKTVTVAVPFDYDLSAMKVTSITLCDGAVADLNVGEVVNCTVPRNIRIQNGDVYTNYTLTAVRDNATFETFMLNNTFHGTIDNVARTIQVFVPMDTDVSNMLVTYTMNEGATATPATSSIVDFTNPVTFTAMYNTAVIPYTVTVIKDDMSQDPKAFIGTAASADALGNEAKAAYEWMIANVPMTTYVCMQDILNGTVKLSEFKMVWCHLDFSPTDWPGIMWDTRDQFNDYYIKGGNILASREAARYINDVWRIALDQQCPNNMFGGEEAALLGADLGFCVANHQHHPLYEGLPIENNRILMVSAGCSNTNRTLQWGVDWDPYKSMEGWETRTGAIAIAQDHNGDINRCTIAEFQPREVLKGYMSGTVITVGTPAFEWHLTAGENKYRPVMEKFTKNAINYLCK